MALTDGSSTNSSSSESSSSSSTCPPLRLVLQWTPRAIFSVLDIDTAVVRRVTLCVVAPSSKHPKLHMHTFDKRARCGVGFELDGHPLAIGFLQFYADCPENTSKLPPSRIVPLFDSGRGVLDVHIDRFDGRNYPELTALRAAVDKLQREIKLNQPRKC